MQLKSLQVFLKVAEYASFGQAAQALHTVQSNITAHVQKLERELGVSLFTRTSPITLTAAGHSLYPYAKRLIQTHDQALACVGAGAEPSGVLRIGAMETTAALRLTPFLSHFHSLYPNVQLALKTGPTAELAQGLSRGEFDCVFVAGQLAVAGYPQRPVFEEQLVLVSAAPLAHVPSAEVLLDSTFLVFRQGCSYRQRVELWMSEQNVQAVRMSEFGSLDALLGCVAAGMGYALLPKALIEQHSRFHLFTHPIRDEIGCVTTYLVSGPETGHSAALKAFCGLFDSAVE